MSQSSRTDRNTRDQLLWEDSDLVLLRRWSDEGSIDASTTLALVPASHPPMPASLSRLAREYELKDDLDGTWAVRPIALVHEGGQHILILEDPGGEPLQRLLGAPMEIGRFLDLAILIVMALGKAHQRGLVHKNIKPANILVSDTSTEVHLTGFGIASRLLRERQSLEPPEDIAGTLAYVAPEQTGRMNRSIDLRSDLYSLGVTYYQMTTGHLPFMASDPMEWVHCHIAREAMPPSERLNTVPVAISAIIMKLLAKTAEERYQTASGVERDLRRCLAEWETQCRIDEFRLGEHDTPDRLLVPEKLYGRTREIESLLAAFDRIVASGTPELVVVSGYAGIGKSAVVNELHKALVPTRGLFASGKFDQYKRDIPYATLAQSFQSLIRPLLGKNEAELHKRRDALLEALGPNGRLMVDLVPELELIIGEQPPVPVLQLQDARRRFQLVFRRFIGVFSRPEHPLALFLDDLQWVDTATLDLLEDLLTQPNVQHLLLIGAYRDNEVDSSHPLARKLEAIRKTGAIVQEINLAPLTSRDLEQLISDSLRCELESTTSLARLVHEKTLGNPFFAIQFISALAEEALLTFDHNAMRWSWDLDRIHAKGYTDNVVDIMVAKLTRLSAQTRKALQLFACIGNRAEYALLATAYEGSSEDLHHDLWEAVQTGLVFRSEGAYRFLHDRVQEAAYSLIPGDARGPAHLRIGRLLASRTVPAEIAGRVFEIVNQLNRGSDLITSADERTRVARFNLIAGTRARASTAYASAIEYLAAGRALLTEEDWQHNYELMFGIEIQRAECELLTANAAAAEQRLSMLVGRAERVQDIAAVARLRLTLYTTLDRSDRAVEVCLEYLRRGGTDWSPHPTRDQVQREYDKIWSQLGSRSIEAVLDLPLMTDPAARAVFDVLTEALYPAHFTDENLLYLIICRMVNLSLNHGNSDGSCFAYGWLGNIAGPCFGSYEIGYRFGRLGYDLVEKRGLHRFQARTYAMFGHNVMPWTRHVRSGRDLIHRAVEIANGIGDLTCATLGRQDLTANLLATGDPLGDTQREAEKGLDFAQRARFGLAIDIITARLCLIRTLRGLTPKFGCFNDTQFDELRFERHLASDERLAVPECWYWILKLQALFFASDYSSAIEASSKAQRLLWTSECFFERTEYEFYTGLSRAALCDSATLDERQCHLEELTAHRKQLELWAANCPENFEARATLMAAEIARIEGRDLDAERSYEQAIRSAKESGFAHIQGIANEVAGRFYLARGLETNAYAHLRDASACFALWGADGKVLQLESLYPPLASPEGRHPAATIAASVSQLDVATVVKASQAVAGEIVLPKLIEQLMTIALQNAGADRGLLVLLQKDGYRIEAEAWVSGGEVVLRHVPAPSPSAPETVIRYVIRTQERVILDDVLRSNLFSEDEYLNRRQPRSLLCLPLVRQGTLGGVLYLENTLTSHAFTPDRTAVLQLLASQAAISLENSRLYGELQEWEASLRRSEGYLAEAQRLSHTGSWAWNVATREIVTWSQETYRLYGFDPEKGTPSFEAFRQRVHPEDRDRLGECFDRAIHQKTPFEVEFRTALPDGTIKCLRSVGHPTFNAAGDVVEMVGTSMDVTEHKLAEEERQAHLWFFESMDRVNRAIQGSNDLERMMSDVLDTVLSIFGCDRAWLVYPCDPDAASWRAAMELTRLDFPGAFALGVDLPMDAEVASVFQTARASGGAVRFGPGSKHPVPAQLAEGFSIQSIIGMAVYPKGDKPYMFGLHQCSHPRIWMPQEERLFREIGRRLGDALTSLLMLRNLRDSEAKLEEAQRITHVGYWERDLETDRIAWSDETYRIFGLAPEERTVTFTVLSELVHPEDRAIVIRAVAEALRGGPRYDVEYRALRPSGEVRIVHSQGDVTRDGSGRPRRMFGTVQDITERKRAEEELLESEQRYREAQMELAHANRLATMGQLSASIAHEVNQPIGAAVANASAALGWLGKTPPDLEEVRQALDRIVTNGNRASDVIGRIRALVQKAPVRKDAFEINGAILEVVALTRGEVSRNGISVQTQLAAGLPLIQGDRVQLQQVILNLIINAIEAMRGLGEGKRELLISTDKFGSDGVLVAVRDSGPGLTPTALERVFDAFYTTKPDGLGLGLSICRSIIEAHGGRLWAIDNVPHGAVFQFTLPVHTTSVS